MLTHSDSPLTEAVIAATAEQKDGMQDGFAPAEQTARSELSPSSELLIFSPTDPDPLETCVRAYCRAVLAIARGSAGELRVWP